MPVATHELSAEEIAFRFGPLLTAGAQAFRDDIWLLVTIAEEWRRDNPRPTTKPQRDEHHAISKALKGELKAAQDVILRQRFHEGESGATVAKELGLSEKTVLDRWRSMGLHASERPRAKVRAARNGARAARERRIIELHAQGLNQTHTGQQLGISQVAVGQAWKRLGLTAQR